jgi:hypothetical protein
MRARIRGTKTSDRVAMGPTTFAGIGLMRDLTLVKG